MSTLSDRVPSAMPKYELGDMVDPIYQARAIAKLYKELHLEGTEEEFRKFITRDDIYNMFMAIDTLLEKIQRINEELL